jgi:hypothetical protein
MPSNIAHSPSSMQYLHFILFFRVFDNCEVYWSGSHVDRCHQVGGVELGDKVRNDTMMESYLVAPSCQIDLTST